MDPAKEDARYQDLLALPEDVRAEILGGTIVTVPAPMPRHSRPQRALGRFIGGPFDDDDGFGGPGGWWIFVEVDVELTAHDVVRPDVAGWRRDRLPRPDQRPIRVVPDWVCEITSIDMGTLKGFPCPPAMVRPGRSPAAPHAIGSSARDRVTKRNLYAVHGVRHYWILDPDARTLEALVLRDATWVDAGTFDETALARVPPFEEVELPVGRLFLPSGSEISSER